MTWRRERGGSLIEFAAMVVAVPAAAQVTGAPSATPTTSTSPMAAAPLPIPPAPVIVLPTPAAWPTPTPTASPPRQVPTKRPVVKAEPIATPSPGEKASPSSVSATATPAPTAKPGVTAPVIAAPATPLPSTPQTPVSDDGFSTLWPIAAAIGGVVVLVLGAMLLRRRRAHPEDEALVEPTLLDPAAAARLTIAFRPIRAGLNLLSAISENEVVLANIGDGPAEDIRLATHLASAHTGQDADLAAMRAAPIDRPAVPAFALAPGEQRAVTSVAILPREAIHALTAAGRPMFVPLVAVEVAYATAGIERRLSQAFAVGIERVDSAKLAPFWLDVPARAVETVAARAHGAAIEDETNGGATRFRRSQPAAPRDRQSTTIPVRTAK